MGIGLFLSGCANLQTTLSATDESWSERQIRLNEVKTWELNARMSLTTPEQTQSFNIQWQEQPEQYHIRVMSTFGQTGALIWGTPQGVEVTTADGTWSGARLEDYVSSELELSLPFSALRYWLLGIPAPGEIGQLQVDANQRLEQLTQHQWQLTYRGYDTQVDLPQRLRLEHQNWRLNVVIQSWDLPLEISHIL